MPARFKEVEPNLLYRGGAPKSWEIKTLKKVFGIEQIISLDKRIAKEIDKDCKDNGISHIVIPLNASNDNDVDLNKIRNGVTNIIKDKVSYVHCLHGKDRTGLFIAKYRTENGQSCNEALDEAISFGFGIGMDKDVISEYIKIICSSCKTKHKHTDINYYSSRVKYAKLCNECGMKKTAKLCHSCFIIDALIKNAGIMQKSIVEESREDDVEKPPNQDDEVVEGVANKSNKPSSLPSSLFSTEKDVKMGRDNRIKFLKKAQQISFKIPDQEKKLAAYCIDLLKKLEEEILFKTTVKGEYKDLLDIMYNPFTENSGITPEHSKKIEPQLKIYCGLLETNLTSIKQYSVNILNVLKKFDSDSDVASMNKSFYDQIDGVDKEIAIFTRIATNVENKDFQQNIIKSIDILRKNGAQLKQLISERIIPYLRKDVLGEDWTTEIKQDLQQDASEAKKEVT